MSDPLPRRYPPSWEKIIPAALTLIGIILLVILGLAVAVALQLIHV